MICLAESTVACGKWHWENRSLSNIMRPISWSQSWLLTHSWHRIWIINWAKVHNSCNVQQALSCQENGTRRQAKDAIPWLPLHAARSYETQKNHSVASCVKSWLLSYSCLQVSLRCWWCFECKQSNLDHFLNGSQMFACATVEGPSMFAPAVVSVERFALGISFCSRP